MGLGLSVSMTPLSWATPPPISITLECSTLRRWALPPSTMCGLLTITPAVRTTVDVVTKGPVSGGGDGNALIENCVATGNTVATGAGVFEVNESVPVGTSPGTITFRNDTAAFNSGTAFYIDGGQTVMNNDVAAFNTATAAFIVDAQIFAGDKLTIKGLLDQGNVNKATSGLGGGFADLASAPASISNSIIRGNVVTGNGGGVYADGSGTVDLTGDIITLNYAQSGAGGGEYLGAGAVILATDNLVAFNFSDVPGTNNIYTA